MDLDALSDEDLLRRSIGGDEDAFTVLVRRHEDRIFSLAWRMTGNRTDALEATQETFVSVFQRAPSFRGEAAFGTWLYQIGVNSCRDLLRKKKRLPVPEADLPETAGAGRSTPEEGVELRMDLARALATIPADYREAVLLHDLGGTPYAEIAALTGVPVGTVKSRISRGRRMLADALEQPAIRATSKGPR